MRALWLMVGLLATACGIAGVVLPLVPATPFLLVAAYAFARSSPRLHDWLMTHRHLGPPIANWNLYGAISRRAKIAAMFVMVATLLSSVIFGMGYEILLIQIGVMSVAAAFIMTRPDGPKPD